MHGYDGDKMSRHFPTRGRRPVKFQQLEGYYPYAPRVEFNYMYRKFEQFIYVDTSSIHSAHVGL